jgi:hypothetical protein
MLTVVHAELAEDIVCSGLTVTIVGTSQLGSPRGNRRKAASRQKRIQNLVQTCDDSFAQPPNPIGPQTWSAGRPHRDSGLGCMGSTQFSRVTGLITAVLRTAHRRPANR